MADHFSRWAAIKLMKRPSSSCPYAAEVVAQRLYDTRVDALILDTLSRSGFDAAIRENLVEARRERIMQDMAREAALERLADLAGKSGNTFLILKGAALAHTHYDQPFHRPSHDIDILVARVAFEGTVTRLLSLGYNLLPTLPGDLVSHAVSLVPENGGPRLDLHRRVSVRPPVSQVLAFETLKERSCPLPGFPPLRMPDSVDLLCHAALHVLGHHGDQDFLLIHAWDVVLLLEHLGCFPEELIRQRMGESLSASVAWYCLWVVELFDLDIQVPKNPRPALGGWQNDWQGYGWIDRFRLARQLGLPSPSYMRSTGRKATPLAYAARLFSGLLRRER